MTFMAIRSITSSLVMCAVVTAGPSAPAVACEQDEGLRRLSDGRCQEAVEIWYESAKHENSIDAPALAVMSPWGMGAEEDEEKYSLGFIQVR